MNPTLTASIARVRAICEQTVETGRINAAHYRLPEAEKSAVMCAKATIIALDALETELRRTDYPDSITDELSVIVSYFPQ